MTHIYINRPTLLILSLMTMAFAVPSYAQDKVVDILPPVTTSSEDSAATIDNETHPIIRITPDKSELIRLEEEAGSIIIGNPLHISVIADSSKTLVIVPKAPGATHFTVLDKKGQIIMQRHVIVASPKEDYIRIKRTCTEDNVGCQDTSVFYCPDMCHEIGLDLEGDSSTSQNETSSGSSDSGSSSNSGLGNETE